MSRVLATSALTLTCTALLGAGTAAASTITPNDATPGCTAVVIRDGAPYYRTFDGPAIGTFQKGGVPGIATDRTGNGRREIDNSFFSTYAIMSESDIACK